MATRRRSSRNRQTPSCADGYNSSRTTSRRGGPQFCRKAGTMRYRTFGRTGWRVGEVGYGMWGMGGWTGSDDVQSRASLEAAVARGVNFLDTAQAYGDGHSELLLGRLMAALPDKRLYAATKVPPKNGQWPSRRGVPLAEVFPRDYLRRYVDISRGNLGMETISLLQLHVWEDDWLADGDLQRTVAELKKEGSIRAFGHQPEPLGAVERRQGRGVGPGRCRPGHLQHLRSGPRRRAVPDLPSQRRRSHRPRALRRGKPDRDVSLWNRSGRRKTGAALTSSRRT